MNFLADENFPRPAVQALRQAGLDVLWIAECRAGAPDDEVLALSVSTSRVLLTFDKDFGELAYHQRLPAHCGIVLFRLTPQSPDEAALLAVAAIRSLESWVGHFSVVTRQSIRMRRLPSCGSDDPAAGTET